jgi:hypothetical protein
MSFLGGRAAAAFLLSCCLATIAAQVTPSQPIFAPPDASTGLTASNDSSPNTQYCTLLGSALWFYDAQRAGKLSDLERERVPWRNDSTPDDGADQGVVCPFIGRRSFSPTELLGSVRRLLRRRQLYQSDACTVIYGKTSRFTYCTTVSTLRAALFDCMGWNRFRPRFRSVRSSCIPRQHPSSGTGLDVRLLLFLALLGSSEAGSTRIPTPTPSSS